jgi:patatin-like phospholipase/acyl hydrolase
MATRTILSIDGGGLRGILPARILQQIETITGKRTAALFDMVAGTSTGGILAVGLAKPNDARTDSALSAADLVKLYQDEGRTIFNRSVWHAVGALGQLNGPKYDGTGERDALMRYLSGARLSETRTAVLVPAYDIEKRLPYFFKSWKAGADPQSDFALVDVARATSAAPTFFPPVQITAGGSTRAFVDGGVFANNPTMCALADAWKMWPGDDLLVVSLGTGNTDRPILYDHAESWGLALWAEPLVEILIDGVTDTVDYQAATVLDDGRYFRFQTDLPQSLQEFDDPDNVPALMAQADNLIAASTERIVTVCGQLMRAKFPGAAKPALDSVA